MTCPRCGEPVGFEMCDCDGYQFADRAERPRVGSWLHAAAVFMVGVPLAAIAVVVFVRWGLSP